MDWEAALNSVVVTPEGYRRPADIAYGLHVLRCSHSELGTLLRACDEAGNPGPDEYDYWNIGLYSGSKRSRPELELAFFWRFFMKRRDWFSPIRHQVKFQAVCPWGAKCESALWGQPDLPGFVWTASRTERGRAWWVGGIERRSTASPMSSELIAEVWHSLLSSYRYQYTCPELAVVVQETRRRKVGDCLAVSMLLAAEFNERAVEARVCTGLILGGVTGRIHAWVEAFDNGNWKSFDLSTAIHAKDFSLNEYADLCFGSLSNRVLRGRAEVLHSCGAEAFSVPLDFRVQ